MADVGDMLMVDRPETEDVLTAPVDGPALGQADAAEDTQQGCLAAAVATLEQQGLAGPRLKSRPLNNTRSSRIHSSPAPSSSMALSVELLSMVIHSRHYPAVAVYSPADPAGIRSTCFVSSRSALPAGQATL